MDDDGNSNVSKGPDTEMFIVGLVLDPTTNSPIVLLKDVSGTLCVPIWIGVPEATSIASALKNIPMSRPMTHDLMCNVIQELGGAVKRVVIHRIEDSTFYASVEIIKDGEVKSVDSRPSDGIALAVRVGCQIYVSEVVIEAAKVHVVTEDLDSAEESDADDRGVSNFTNLDRDRWVEILEEMDPTDFKYKM